MSHPARSNSLSPINLPCLRLNANRQQMSESSLTQSFYPPSRDLNPFATCWTRAGALPYRFNKGQYVEQLLAQLVVQQWLGAIIGPHGSGKSTLLESLKPTIVAAGRSLQAISLHDGQRR